MNPASVVGDLRIAGLFSCVFCLSLLATGIQVAASPSESPDPGLTDAVSHAPEVQATNYVYLNYTEIKNHLLAIQSKYPDISKVYDIGNSWEKNQGTADRDILAIKISDNVAVDENEPEVLIVGLHHAREWTTSELALAIAENLTAKYQNDSRLSWLVDNREIWIVPIVNPDGLDYALETDQWWRKNRHLNGDGSYGVDLNRNYGGSMNGDSAGAWGGAGSSHVPSNEVYCGLGPFSEPETQAVRDLVLARNFTLMLDYHSFGDLVMWPWGYNANKTADDADLVRIGNEFAALNGYIPEQSVGLYPTTGDSIDWMYGAEDVYPFCFEVGQLFHPTSTADVLGIIGENLPPAYLGIEIAGDRQERPFQIEHATVSARDYSSSGFLVDANITAARGVDVVALSVFYSVDGGAWSDVGMARLAGNDSYEAMIPAQSIGSIVDYYIVAHDVSGVELMSPRYAPYELHSFLVTAGSTPPIAEAGDDRSVLVGETVVLDGSGSTDDIGIENYTWTFTYNGSPVSLYGPTPSFEFWVPGVYEIVLNVSDAAGLHGIDMVNVTVSGEPIPEFGSLLVPTVLLLILAVGLRRRTSKGS
ncbi:MAG: M14 family zinc carboxypeptidase [Thermoplasmatota archaeon]|nr:hypothetical protein [Candidatus Thermoplasmatota archaeon]